MTGVSIGSEDTKRALASMSADIDYVGDILNIMVNNATDAAESVQHKNTLLETCLEIFTEERENFEKVKQSMENIKGVFRKIDQIMQESAVDTAQQIEAMRR
jgi:methyl-accepting chemotaxis protein